MSLVPTAWIPYPRPPVSVELRSGVLYSGCQCVKRDGMQQDCPRTGCQGRAPCLAFPAPACVPSGNGHPPPSRVKKEPYNPWLHAKRARPTAKETYQGLRAQPPPHDPGHDSPYVRKGRECYIENPPVRERKVPCREHKKPRE